MRVLSTAAMILVLIGAVNWGLVGLFQFDLVGMLLGHGAILSRLVYSLVGIAGVFLAYKMFDEFACEHHCWPHKMAH